MFVSGCKNYSVPQIVHRLKGASAYKIRHELWERIKHKLWGDAFWSGGYFYRSVGSTTAEAVRFYVENSQRRHWLKHEPDDYETKPQDTSSNGEEDEEDEHQARLDEF